MFKVLLLGAFYMLPHLADAETWTVTSLEWPPFSGSTLPEGGAGIAVLRAALKVEGIELQVKYYPWTRALMTSKMKGYAGVYPTWPEDVPAGFTPSVVLFESPVGLVEPVSKPIVWSKLSDLSGKSIGTVQDYGNTPEFMALIKSGDIKTEVVADDLSNVRKVAAGHLDAAFIDLNNLDYLLKHEAKAVAAKVQANSKTIDNKALLLAINNNFGNPNASTILRKGVSKIKPKEIIKNYMEKYLKYLK